MNVMDMKGSEKVAVVATIDPDAYSTGTYVSDYVNASEFNNYMAVIAVGTLGTSATVDAKIVQATTSTGAGSKDVTGSDITQLTQASTDSDKQAIINVRPEDLDTDNSFDYLAVSMTVSVAASDAYAELLGIDPRHGPASDNDLSSVDEIVTV